MKLQRYQRRPVDLWSLRLWDQGSRVSGFQGLGAFAVPNASDVTWLGLCAPWKAGVDTLRAVSIGSEALCTKHRRDRREISTSIDTKLQTRPHTSTNGCVQHLQNE